MPTRNQSMELEVSVAFFRHQAGGAAALAQPTGATSDVDERTCGPNAELAIDNGRDHLLEVYIPVGN